MLAGIPTSRDALTESERVHGVGWKLQDLQGGRGNVCFVMRVSMVYYLRVRHTYSDHIQSSLYGRTFENSVVHYVLNFQ